MEKDLIGIINRLIIEVEEIRKKRSVVRKRTKKQALISLICHKYQELVLILERIFSDEDKIQKVQKEWTDSFKKKKKKFSQEKGRLMFKLNDFLKLDIKSLYVWIYDIHFILEDSKIQIDLSELRRLTLVRSKFITHITGTEFFKSRAVLSAGVKTGGEKGSILMLHDLFSKKNLFKGIQNLVAKCEEHITKLRGVKNQYEQIQIIFENINKLPNGSIKSSAKKFIYQSGISTEPPTKIALILLETIRRFRIKVKV